MRVVTGSILVVVSARGCQYWRRYDRYGEKLKIMKIKIHAKKLKSRNEMDDFKIVRGGENMKMAPKDVRGHGACFGRGFRVWRELLT
jgi:hypothetical protein